MPPTRGRGSPPVRPAVGRWRRRPGPGAWKPEAAAGPGRQAPGRGRPGRVHTLCAASSRRQPPAFGPEGGAAGCLERASRMPPGPAAPGPPGNMGVLRAGLCPGLTQDMVQLLQSRGIKTGDRGRAPVRATWLGPARRLAPALAHWVGPLPCLRRPQPSGRAWEGGTGQAPLQEG